MTTTLKKGLLVTGLLLSSFILKPNNGTETQTLLETEKTIKDSVKFPTGMQITDQKVEILFTTAQNGDVNFVLAKTNNTELKKEIEKQFYALHFQNLNTNAVNSVVLNFKTLK